VLTADITGPDNGGTNCSRWCCYVGLL